jgi:SAM-dependent methyltransferase
VIESVSPGERARTFFDDVWKQGDPWEFGSSEFERERYRRLIEVLADRHYDRVLEIGCGAGIFTRQLATLAGTVVAIDVSEKAIDAAKEHPVAAREIDFRVANIMEYDVLGEAPWDLVVMSETIYYLGWLYPFFDIAWLAHQLCAATAPEGRLLLANTCGSNDYLLLPWIIQTYHDLFVNVGYRIDRHQTFRGTKNATDLETIVTVFLKPAPGRC